MSGLARWIANLGRRPTPNPIPSGLASGTYDLHVLLPDASSNFESNVAHRVRLANVGTWDAATGYNSLLASVTAA